MNNTQDYQALRLILRSTLPDDLEEHYRDIIRTCSVEVIDRFLESEDLEKLLTRVFDQALVPALD